MCLVSTSRRQHRYYALHWYLNWLYCQCSCSSTATRWVEVVLLVVTALVGCLANAIQFADTTGQNITGWRKLFLDEIYHARFEWFVVLIVVEVVTWISYVALRWMHPINLSVSKDFLNHIAEHHFSSPDKLTYVYRATLFKIRGWRYITGEWLGIVSRSGETHDRSGTIFAIDRMRPLCNTGIAGKCFLGEGTTLIYPEVLDPANEDAYKLACGLDDREYKAMNIKATVLMATGIRRNGKMWGILVLDTNDARCLPSPTATIHNSAKKHEDDIGHWAFTLGLFVN